MALQYYSDGWMTLQIAKHSLNDVKGTHIARDRTGIKISLVH